MPRRVNFASSLVFLVLVCLSSNFLYAQSNAAISVTGCLKQGGEKGGFYITAQDGTFYELVGKSANLSQHVNHTVTVTGSEVKLSEAHESAVAEYERTESGGKTYTDLHVTGLKMVSESCTQ